MSDDRRLNVVRSFINLLAQGFDGGNVSVRTRESSGSVVRRLPVFPPPKTTSDGLSYIEHNATMNVATSCIHPQLRDLVHTTDSDAVIFTNQFSIQRIDCETHIPQVLHELTFKPTAMTVTRDYLVAGGSNSHLFVQDLISQRVLYDESIQSEVINGVHIHEVAGASSLKLLVCANDNTIKVFDLPSMLLSAVLSFPVPQNAAAISPDGQHMVCGGDSANVSFFSSHGDSFSPRCQLSEAKDSAFSVAWSPNSLTVAVGSQDGLVCVWDVRSERLLSKVAAHQPGPRGAVRCVKFAPAPLDMFVFTEQVSYASVVDGRCVGEVEVVALASSFETSLSGCSFSADGSKLYFGMEDALVEYRVDTRSRRMFGSTSLA